MVTGRRTLLLFSLVPCAIGALRPARAALTISGAPTHHVACIDGTCTATAAQATLNVGELGALLKHRDIFVVAGAQAADIVVAETLIWQTGHGLTLDAAHSVRIDAQILVAGVGQVAIRVSDGQPGGVLSFAPHGRMRFLTPYNAASAQAASQALTINGQNYIIVRSVAELASAALPGAHVALADDYDAAFDKTYHSAPVSAPFNGVFEGLGNNIFHLKVVSSGSGGLFSELGGTVENINLVSTDVRSTQDSAGAIAGQIMGGVLFNDQSSGFVSASGTAFVGGLAGVQNGGSITECASTTAVSAPAGMAGGLVGEVSQGQITQSYATGPVQGATAGGVAGLLGFFSLVENVYAKGTVTGTAANASVGGLVGEMPYSAGSVGISYGVGRVRMGAQTLTGGLVGEFETFPGAPHNPLLFNDDWDVPTTHQADATGSGTPSGATGLTNAQLRSELPRGFNNSIWGQNPKINGGFPYLLAKPPE